MSTGAEVFTQSRRRRSAWTGPLAIVLLFIVAMLIISLFFRVKRIEVVNASEYSDAQIIEASGLQTGVNLFFVDRFSAASLVFSKLPYMEAVSIQRSLPDTIVIQAAGTAASSWLNVHGENWLVDRKGLMLEAVDLSLTAGFREIRGITVMDPVEGELMTVEPGQEGRLETLKALLTALTGEDMISSVQWIDVSNPSNVSLRAQDRMTVYLGELTDVSYQTALLRNVLQQLTPDDAGTLSYAGGGTWNYSPD